MPELEPDSAAPPFTLTCRQIVLGELVCDGLSNKEISDRVGITEHTVKFHVFEMCKRIAAKNRTHAAAILTRTRIAFPAAWAEWRGRAEEKLRRDGRQRKPYAGEGMHDGTNDYAYPNPSDPQQ